MYLLYTIVIISVLWAYFKFFKRRPLNGIPGPRGIPLFGNLFQLDLKTPHLKLNEWAHQHGDVYQLNLSGTSVLVVTGYNELREVLVRKGSDFGGRPYSYVADISTTGFKEITLTDMGPELKWRRKLVHSYIKQYATGLNEIERITESAVRELIDELVESNETPIDFVDKLSTTLINIMCVMLRGAPVSKSEAVKQRQNMNKAMPLFAPGGPASYLDMFPWLRYFRNHAYKTILQVIDERHNFFHPWIEEARMKESEGLIRNLTSLPENETQEHGIDNTLIECLSQTLVAAGSTTTLGTLSFLINTLVHHPIIQRKLQDEILEAVGERSITFMDKRIMPFHQAVLFEAARLASVVPLSVPHKTTRRTSINDFIIPKDTMVWCNLWGLHHDVRQWDDPFKFDPERFLDADGQLVPADHPNRLHLLPFGAGARVCVGEVFAQSRMFLILAMMMQHFTVLPERDLEDQPSWDPREMTLGVVLSPTPFRVVMKKRE